MAVIFPGMSDLSKAATELSHAFHGVFETMTDSGDAARKQLDKFRQGIENIGSESGSVAKEIGGMTRGSKGFVVGAGAFVGGLKGMTWALDRATAPLKDWTVAQHDAAREAIRGTAMISSSSSELALNQSRIVRGAVEVRKSTGMLEAGATQLSAGIEEAIVMSGNNIDKTGAAYIINMARMSQLTGMGADQTAEFNRTMLVSLRSTPKATEETFRLIFATTRFGLKGAEAAKLLEDSYGQMMLIGREGEDAQLAFTKNLLESAALFKTAGVDFSRSVGKLTESEGSKQATEAAKLAALTNRSFEDVLKIMQLSQFNNADARKELIQIKGEAAEAGLSMGGLSKKDLADAITTATVKNGTVNGFSGDLSTALLTAGIVGQTSLFSDLDLGGVQKMLEAQADQTKITAAQGTMAARGGLQTVDNDTLKALVDGNKTLRETIESATTTWVDAMHGFSTRADELARAATGLTGAITNFASPFIETVASLIAVWESAKLLYSGFKILSTVGSAGALAGEGGLLASAAGAVGAVLPILGAGAALAAVGGIAYLVTSGIMKRTGAADWLADKYGNLNGDNYHREKLGKSASTEDIQDGLAFSGMNISDEAKKHMGYVAKLQSMGYHLGGPAKNLNLTPAQVDQWGQGSLTDLSKYEVTPAQSISPAPQAVQVMKQMPEDVHDTELPVAAPPSAQSQIIDTLSGKESAQTLKAIQSLIAELVAHHDENMGMGEGLSLTA